MQYRGRNIADVLDMTVREAFTFFRGSTKVQARLKRLIDVGLDYLRLGQPANTLSGGEAQRLKLAGYMSAAKRSRTLFILDEPTTGLHFADVVQLLDCFEALLAVGHSLIVVEHNLQMMKAADYIIDLGPGAADEGGRIVSQGTPEFIARQEQIGDRAIPCRSAGPPTAGATGVTQDCGDDRMARARQLELFFGDASDAVARVYARLPCDETTTGSQLTGELIGPECRFAQTLSARIPFQDRGPGESLIAEAVVPDPCFWTPELPMLYKARIERKGPEVIGRVPGIEEHEVVVTGRAPEQESFTTFEKWLGIRRLGTRGRSLILDTERWVPRGIWLDRIGRDDLKAAREADVVLCGPPPDDEICLKASRHGVPLLIELSAPPERLADEVRRLGQWPAVFLVVLEPEAAIDAAIRGSARNLLFAAKFATDKPIVPPPWAQLLFCNVTAESASRVRDVPLPILARRRASIDIRAARAACDRLQYDLAPAGDFAGYLV